jgi:hypothetical protein
MQANPNEGREIGPEKSTDLDASQKGQPGQEARQRLPADSIAGIARLVQKSEKQLANVSGISQMIRETEKQFANVSGISRFMEEAHEQVGLISSGLTGDWSSRLATSVGPAVDIAGAVTRVAENDYAPGEVASTADLAAIQVFLVRTLAAIRALLPTEEFTEKMTTALSLTVLLVVSAGVLKDSNPHAYKELNELLSSPLGILGVVLAVVFGSQRKDG